MRRPLRTAVAFCSLLVVALLVPMPRGGRAVGCFGNVLHVITFAVLGVLVLRVARRRLAWPDRRRALLAFAVVSGFGILTELLQAFVGRQPSWQDVLADTCGAGAGILWLQAWTAPSAGSRFALAGMGGLAGLIGIAQPLAVAADILLQRRAMPMLASFEQPLELLRWKYRECRIRRVRDHAADGDWSLRIDLEPGLYPGVALEQPAADWSAFDELVLEIHLGDGPPLDLVVKVEDLQHNHEHEDRFHQIERLLPGRNAIRVDLASVEAAPRGRRMDMQHLSTLSFFAVELESPRTLYLDRIELRGQRTER